MAKLNNLMDIYNAQEGAPVLTVVGSRMLEERQPIRTAQEARLDPQLGRHYNADNVDVQCSLGKFKPPNKASFVTVTKIN